MTEYLENVFSCNEIETRQYHHLNGSLGLDLLWMY